MHLVAYLLFGRLSAIQGDYHTRREPARDNVMVCTWGIMAGTIETLWQAKGPRPRVVIRRAEGLERYGYIVQQSEAYRPRSRAARRRQGAERLSHSPLPCARR